VGEGLYIHVPFCRRRCRYCALPSTEGRLSEIDDYIRAIGIEARRRCQGRSFDTVFIGGGTPTVLSAKQLDTMLSAIFRWSVRAEGCEVTVEANPESLDEEKLAVLLSHGVNRISLGVQSFDDESCSFLGRLHRGPDAVAAVNLLQRMGIGRISLDLLCGYPGNTAVAWDETLHKALSLRPEHLSVYLYHQEAGTPLDDDIEQGRVSALNEDEQIHRYYQAKETLEASGYEHYEISNFALPGARSRHNVRYWYGGDYCGIGAGAASHELGERFVNVADPADYVRLIDDDRFGWRERERLDAKAKWRENLMLRLRMLDPVLLTDVLPIPGKTVVDETLAELRNCVDEGLLHESSRGFCLSHQGLILSNEVFVRVI